MADEYGTEPEKAEVTDNEDGSVTVDLTPPVNELPDEAFNLVPHYHGTDEGKKFLEKLADKVLADVRDGWDSASDYRKKRKTRWKLIVGDLDPKTFPFEDCANVHLPVMLERVLRLFARIWAEVFPTRDFVWTTLPTTQLSQERADILTLHQDLQIRKEIPDFFRHMRRALLEFIVNGDIVIHSYRDIPNNRNVHEFLHCEEIIWPYFHKTTRVDLSDVPWKARILHKFKHELLELARSGHYHLRPDEKTPESKTHELFTKYPSPSFESPLDKPVREASDKFEGRDSTATPKAAPYELYEYHGLCKLPGQEEDRPVTVTVEPVTKEILCLTLREQEDWKDRVRFNRETEELANYQAQQAQFAQMQEQKQALEMEFATVPPPDPMFDPMGAEAFVAKQAQHSQLSQVPPPPAPKWLKPEMAGPKPVRLVPIENFSHGVCIENLEGSLGLGIGLLLQPFNETANTVASQFIDSATLANVSTAIVPWTAELESGDNRLTPGEWNRVRNVSADQIKNAVSFVQHPQANPQLLDMIQMSLESADGVSSAPDVLSGEAGKANETYRGISTRVEQATKQLTFIADCFLEPVSQVAKNNARLNSVFLGDDEIKHVINPRTQEPSEIVISRALYAEDMDISFTADTRFAGRAQKMDEAMQMVTLPANLPPPLMPMIPPAFIFEGLVKLLKASGAHDMIRFLGPRPPMPTLPFGAPPPGMPPGMGGPGGAPPMGGAPPPPPPPPPGGPTSTGPDGQPVQGPPAPPPPQ